MFGPRRHDLPHYLIAELHHRLHQFAVLLPDEPLLGARRNQRLNVIGGGGRLFRRRAGIRQFHQRLEELQRRHAGVRGPRQRPQQRNQRHEPPAARPAVEQLRHGVRSDGHGHPSRENRLPEERPIARSAIHEPRQIKDAHEGQKGVLDQRKSARPVFGF